VRSEGGKNVTFTRETDARAAAHEEERKVSKKEWIDPDLRGVTLAEWAEKWLKGTRHLKPKTVVSYESLLSSRILPTFGHRELRSIKPSDVTEWVGAMIADDLSPSRIRQSHVVLRLVLESAVRDDYITRNVALGAKLPRLEHREAPYFEPQVVDALVEAMKGPYELLTAILGICGLRWGEAVALRRRHADLLRRRLRVEQSLAEVSGHFVFGSTKSHAQRSVPLSAGMVTALARHLEDLDVDPQTLLFTGPKGGALRYRYFYMKQWRPALEALDLPAVGVHALRHSAAARIVGAGGSAKTLQTVLGHRSASFSYTVYGHLLDADLDELADRLDTVREKGAQ
jgi:integrase